MKKKREDLKKSKYKDGIVPKIGVSEEVRDQLKKRNWKEKPKLDRADPNNMTTKELEQHRFSGVRNNKFTNQCELWLDGHVRATANADKVAKDPSVLAEMHERVFKTLGSLIDIEPLKH